MYLRVYGHPILLQPPQKPEKRPRIAEPATSPRLEKTLPRPPTLREGISIHLSVQLFLLSSGYFFSILFAVFRPG